MEVRGWRDGGPRGADGPRGRWADPRPAPGRVGADGLGPAPAGDGQLRVSPRAAGGRAVFHFFPQTALLITRVVHPRSPTALRLARLPARVRSPKSSRGPLPRAAQSSPTPNIAEAEEEGGGGKVGYLVFQKDAQCMVWNHVTLPASHLTRRMELADSCGPTEGCSAVTGLGANVAVAGILTLWAPGVYTEPPLGLSGTLGTRRILAGWMNP